MTMDERFLRDHEIAERYGVSRITPWVWARNGDFPQPIKLSPGTTRWRLSEVEAYEQSL
jgi:prophage regulatory protein